MLEALSKLALTWFGNPLRALGTAMIAATIAIALRDWHPFAEMMKDPLWRWPLLMLVVSFAGLVTYPIGNAWDWISEKRRQARADRKVLSRLEDLTPSEKGVLQRYLQEESKTEQWSRLLGGGVTTLERDGILSLVASDPNPNNPPPDLYTINETAWKHLNTHPELVDLQRVQPVTPPL